MASGMINYNYMWWYIYFLISLSYHVL